MSNPNVHPYAHPMSAQFWPQQSMAAGGAPQHAMPPAAYGMPAGMPHQQNILPQYNQQPHGQNNNVQLVQVLHTGQQGMPGGWPMGMMPIVLLPYQGGQPSQSPPQPLMPPGQRSGGNTPTSTFNNASPPLGNTANSMFSGTANSTRPAPLAGFTPLTATQTTSGQTQSQLLNSHLGISQSSLSVSSNMGASGDLTSQIRSPQSLYVSPVGQLPPSTDQWQPIRAADVCKECLAGRCARNPCRFVHLPPTLRPFPEAVCKQFNNTGGRCLHHPCRYFHGSDQVYEETMALFFSMTLDRSDVFVDTNGNLGVGGNYVRVFQPPQRRMSSSLQGGSLPSGALPS